MTDPREPEPAPDGGRAVMIMAGAAAATVLREHTPHKSRRSRQADPPSYCTRCGHLWPCHPVLLARALRQAAPVWQWARDNAETIRQAFMDAAVQVAEHGLDATGTRNLDPVADRFGELFP